jgi:hypothetical protein
MEQVSVLLVCVLVVYPVAYVNCMSRFLIRSRRAASDDARPAAEHAGACDAVLCGVMCVFTLCIAYIVRLWRCH